MRYPKEKQEKAPSDERRHCRNVTEIEISSVIEISKAQCVHGNHKLITIHTRTDRNDGVILDDET